MSRNISELASNRAGVRAGEKYGIEVEGEGCPVETVPDMRWSAQYQAYWSVTGDGSLRNGGIEFLSKPLGRTAVRHAIDALWPYFKMQRVVPSVRTGIHIHASFLGLTTEHVLRVIRHYALVEPVLFNYVGAEREENIYCIPWYRSPSEANTAYTWLRSWEPASDGRTEEPCKYSALYVAPLSRFGTIEFRHAPTWTDPDVMFRWWQMVQAIWRTHQTDYDVLDKWNELGPVGFARSVFKVDWLPDMDESVFIDADVDTVCSLIGEPKVLTAVDWGMAPELAGPGRVTPAARRNAADELLDTMLAPRVARAPPPLAPRIFVDDDDVALTVNATPRAELRIERNDDEEEREF